jgi:hypothetical protein
MAAEVHHHRHVRFTAGLDRTEDGIPFRPGIVRHLDPDDDARMLADAHRRQLRVHVGEVLLDRSALHARADDVDERQHPRAGPVDHLLLELQEISPPGAAHVDERRLAAPEGMAVGLHRRVRVAEIRILLRAEENVRVDVDEAGHHVHAGRIGGTSGGTRIDVRGDAGNLPSGNCHVHDAVHPAGGIDDVAALDQQIDRRGLRGHEAHRRAEQEGDDHQRQVCRSKGHARLLYLFSWLGGPGAREIPASGAREPGGSRVTSGMRVRKTRPPMRSSGSTISVKPSRCS